MRKMKIKNAKNFSLSKVLPLFIVLSVVCSVIRTIQVGFFIDAETGFFKSESFVNILLYVVLALSFVFFCVSAFLSKDCAGLQLPGIKSKALSAVTLLFAFSLLSDWVISFFSCVKTFSLIEDVSMGLFKTLMASGALPAFLQSIFAVFSAIYMFLLASSFKNGSKKASEHKLLALAPVCWACFRMIRLFVTEISFVQISDLLLELVLIGFLVLFFVSLAQNVSGIYVEGFQWRIFAFGLCAALISVSLAVSRLIFTVINFSEYINSQYTFDFCDAAFFVFALVLAGVMIKNKNVDSQKEVIDKE